MYVMCRRGPSKKKVKRMRRKQQEEMPALCNAVTKKDEGQENQKQEELDPNTGSTFTQEIEYQQVVQCGSPLVYWHEQLNTANGSVVVIRKGYHRSLML
jgi:hypothetical protein